MNETPIFIGLLHKVLQQAIHCTAGSDPSTTHPRGANFSARGTKEGRSKAEAMQNSRRINGVTLHCKGSPVQARDTGRSRDVTALFHLPKSPHEKANWPFMRMEVVWLAGDTGLASCLHSKQI